MKNLAPLKIIVALSTIMLLSGFVVSKSAFAHNGDGCLLIPVPLENVVQSSSLIVEAKVVKQRSFWNAAHNQIFTAHTLDVFTLIKGKINVKNLEVLTLGGMVGNDIMIVTPSLSMLPGASGIFCLNPHNKAEDKEGKQYFDIYTEMQGFIAYDFSDKKAELPFETFNLANDEAMDKVIMFSKTPIVKSFKKMPEKTTMLNKSGKSLMAVQAVVGFSPTTISAGTNSVLTITGTGFGASRGNGFIEFSWTDTVPSKFVKAFNADIVSWNDVEIKVKVPGVTQLGNRIVGSAGTGPFRITTNSGSVFTSPSNLTVTFSHFNYALTALQGTPTNPVPLEIMLASAESGRGYTLKYNQSFTSNSAAKASFERALNNWKCAQGANFTIDPNTLSTATTINAADGQNTVMFDNPSSSLGVGILGRGTGHLTFCGTATAVVSVLTKEVDFVFSRNAAGRTWNFLTNNSSILGSEIDFNSVALHEAGHTLLLGHSLNPGDVMFPSISPGVINRSLKPNDIQGAAYVLNKSVANTSLCSGLSAYQRSPFSALSSTITPLTGLDACQLATVSFQSSTNGFNPLFTWLKNGSQITNETITTGSETSRMDAQNLNPNDQITLKVDACGLSTTSAPTTITGISINPNVVTGPITGPICVNRNTNNTYSVPLVTGATKYAWRATNLTTISGTTPSVSVSFNRNDNLTVTASNECSSAQVSIGLPVNLILPAPGTITGPTCVNSGQSSNNTYSVPLDIGATQYNWSGAATTEFTGSIMSETAAAVGATLTANDNLVVRAQNACGISPASPALSVRIIPATPGVISGATTNVCRKTNAYSVAAVPNATTYSWTVPTGCSISGVTTGSSINMVASNSFSSSGTIRLRAVNGTCTSGVASLNISALPPAPIITGASILSRGTTTQYSVPAIAGAVANWTFISPNPILFPTVQLTGNSVWYTVPSQYSFSTISIQVKYTNACGVSTTTTKTLNIFPLFGARYATDNEPILKISTYPNPTTGSLNINFDGFITNEKIDLQVLNISGKTMFQSDWQFQEGMENSTQLDLNQIPSGLYLLQVKQGDQLSMKRFVKE